MTNKNKFIYNGMLMTAVNLLIRGAAMFFGAYVSRRIGAEGVGLYSIIMTVYAFSLTLATSGVGLTVTRHVAGKIGEAKDCEISGVMRGAAVYATAFGILSTLVFYFGADLISPLALRDERAIAPIRVLALSLLPSALSGVLSGYFIGVKRAFSNALAQVISFVAKILLTVIFLTSASIGGVGEGVFLVCLAISVSEFIGLIVLYVSYVFVRISGGAGIELAPVAKDSLALAFSAYVRSALVTLEHILIPRGLKRHSGDSAEALSSYGTLHGMALPLVLFPMSPLSSFSGLLVPEFAECKARGDTRRSERICSLAMERTLAYSVLTAALVFVFSEELGYALYSSYGAGRFIALLAPVVPIMYLDHVTDSILKGIGEHVYSMWVNISDSFLSVILVLLLIPRMGISGYALVIIVMEGYNFLMSYTRLKKRISFKVNIYRAIVSPAISAAISAIVVSRLFVMCSSESGVLWITLKLIFSVCVFLPVNFCLNGMAMRLRIRTRVKPEYEA